MASLETQLANVKAQAEADAERRAPESGHGALRHARGGYQGARAALKRTPSTFSGRAHDPATIWRAHPRRDRRRSSRRDASARRVSARIAPRQDSGVPIVCFIRRRAPLAPLAGCGRARRPESLARGDERRARQVQGQGQRAGRLRRAARRLRGPPEGARQISRPRNPRQTHARTHCLGRTEELFFVFSARGENAFVSLANARRPRSTDAFPRRRAAATPS